ncbi:MAG: sugar ABC transporter ATP-binding protein [Anaerolineales bacterium]
MDTSMAERQYLVEMKHITKKFPGVVALSEVNFQLLPGEVHILLGENGAGKSTLIKVLSGAYVATAGEIFIEGQRVEIASPQDAIDKGLRFIYQELSLVRELDIARNMFLGMEPMLAPGIIDITKLYKEAAKFLQLFHIDLNPRSVVGQLSVTQQKMVEIARALTTKAKAIVMDEPTDVLEDQSRKNLFEVIRRLKKENNVGFIYISHRYAEVYELGDRVTILRDGCNEGTYPIKDLTFEEMVEKMIGGQIKKQYPALPKASPETLLEVKHLSRGKLLDDISLTIQRGEIVGVTGLMGAGKTELGRAIAGVDRMDRGELFLGGRRVRYSDPEKAIREGVAYLPEDRKTEGLILDHTIRNNYALPSLNRLSRWGMVQHRQLDMEAAGYMNRLNIKAPGINTFARNLSGGNQQKTVVAKWLGAQCKVLVFDEPTRGIDINGKREIYRIMEELLEQGVGILMLTSDYTEALEMSHRIIVMSRGKICKEYRRGEPTEADILRVAIGLPTFNEYTHAI